MPGVEMSSSVVERWLMVHLVKSIPHGNPLSWSEMYLHGKKSDHSWCDGSSDRSFMVDPMSYFLFQPVLHDWINKGCGMCYPVCGMVHIKEPLLERVAHVAAAGFLSRYLSGPLPCLMPYNRN